jgi:type IV pilus assembly protein PilE
MVVVVAIIGILIGIAYPSYTSYMQAGRRTDGKAAIMDLAAHMERYFTTNNTYAGATLTNLGMSATSPSGYYTLSITTATATDYTVQAAPTGVQASDTLCGTYTLNQLGQKGETGTGSVADCW